MFIIKRIRHPSSANCPRDIRDVLDNSGRTCAVVALADDFGMTRVPEWVKHIIVLSGIVTLIEVLLCTLSNTGNAFYCQKLLHLGGLAVYFYTQDLGGHKHHGTNNKKIYWSCNDGILSLSWLYYL